MPMRVEHSAFIQNPAPAFSNKTAVVNGLFEQVSLDQYKGKWVVLAFVPMAFTFVCPTEIVAFSDKIQEFKNRNTEVLFASTDSEYTLLAWSNTARKDGGLGKINLPLISDANHKLSYEYGVILPEMGISLRGLFIIDPKGILRQITINDLPVGRSVDETLRLLDAFQFTDKHGEVCPANWQKGADTIDTSNASKYFAKQK